MQAYLLRHCSIFRFLFFWPIRQTAFRIPLDSFYRQLKWWMEFQWCNNRNFQKIETAQKNSYDGIQYYGKEKKNIPIKQYSDRVFTMYLQIKPIIHEAFSAFTDIGFTDFGYSEIIIYTAAKYGIQKPAVQCENQIQKIKHFFTTGLVLTRWPKGTMPHYKYVFLSSLWWLAKHFLKIRLLLKTRASFEQREINLKRVQFGCPIFFRVHFFTYSSLVYAFLQLLIGHLQTTKL